MVTEVWYIEELKKKDDKIKQLTSKAESFQLLLQKRDSESNGRKKGKRTSTPLLVIVFIVAVVCCVLFRDPLRRHARPALESACRYALSDDKKSGMTDPWASRPVNSFGL